MNMAPPSAPAIAPEAREPPPAPGRTIVVGDLHGCRDEALDLLDRLAVTSRDRVIFTGDLVDRGPDPKGCVALARQHACVLGNHEDLHVAQRRRPAEALRPDHARTRGLLDEDDLDWFATLPLWLRLPEHGAAVVHAGALPGLALEEQPRRALLHAQCLDPAGSGRSAWPSKAPPGWRFWTDAWTGPERLIFGHTVLDRPLALPHAVGVDTGCVHGLALTAVVLPGWELVQVPARRPWCTSRGRGVARYPVAAGVSCFS